MAEITIEDKKVKTPKFRVSYPNVFKPKETQSGEKRFSITMLFKESTDISALRKAVNIAAEEKWGRKDKWPKKLKMPFRIGNDERPDDENYEDMIFVEANCKEGKKPQVVELIDGEFEDVSEEDFYAGCYARATIIACAYDVEGSKGVKFALQNIQKLADGEPLAKRRNASDDFADDDEDSKDSKKFKDKKSKKKSRDDDDDDEDEDDYGF